MNHMRGLGDDGDFFEDDLPDPGSGDSSIFTSDPGIDTSQSQVPTSIQTDDPSVSNVSVDALGNVSYTDSNGNPVTVTSDMINAASPATATAGADQVTGNLQNSPAGAAVLTSNPQLGNQIASAMSSGNISALAALGQTALQVYRANGATQLQQQQLANSFALQQQRLLNSRTQMPLLLFAGVAVAFLVMRGKH